MALGEGKVEIQLQGAALRVEVGKGCPKELWMQKQGEGGGGQPSQGSPMHQHTPGRGEALRWLLAAQTEHFRLLADALTVMTFSHTFPFSVPVIPTVLLQSFLFFFLSPCSTSSYPSTPASPIRSTTLVNTLSVCFSSSCQPFNASFWDFHFLLN